MKKKLFILGLTFLITMSLNLFGFDAEEKEEIRKTLKFQNPAQPKKVQVDNIWGSIKVEGTSVQDVELVVHKTIKGRSKAEIQKAKEEVELAITEEGNLIDLYVDGPFRCSRKRGEERGWRNPGYEVHFDFELKIPRKTNLSLKTVTDGYIFVNNVEGEFEVKNVNGRIEMRDVAGEGKASTVNGKVKVLFNRNPKSDCLFKTISGDIEVSFLENLSADFRLKTFNGEAYSDFPFTYLPQRATKALREEGKYRFKSDRFVGVRIQKGGPEIEIDTFNGDILITKKTQ